MEGKVSPQWSLRKCVPYSQKAVVLRWTAGGTGAHAGNGTSSTWNVPNWNRQIFVPLSPMSHRNVVLCTVHFRGNGLEHPDRYRQCLIDSTYQALGVPSRSL